MRTREVSSLSLSRQKTTKKIVIDYYLPALIAGADLALVNLFSWQAVVLKAMEQCEQQYMIERVSEGGSVVDGTSTKSVSFFCNSLHRGETSKMEVILGKGNVKWRDECKAV